jgi:hypothetical protein
MSFIENSHWYYMKYGPISKHYLVIDKGMRFELRYDGARATQEIYCENPGKPCESCQSDSTLRLNMTLG